MEYETGIYGGFVQFQDMEEKSTYILSFSIAFIFCFLLSDKIVAFAEKYDTSMQILEPSYGPSVIATQYCYHQ